MGNTINNEQWAIIKDVIGQLLALLTLVARFARVIGRIGVEIEALVYYI